MGRACRAHALNRSGLAAEVGTHGT
jgi:hypothetical protein